MHSKKKNSRRLRVNAIQRQLCCKICAFSLSCTVHTMHTLLSAEVDLTGNIINYELFSLVVLIS